MEGRWELPTVEPSPSWLGQAILRRVMSNSDRQIEQGTWNRAAAASMGPLPSPARKTPGRIRTPFLAYDFLPSIAPSPSFQSPVCPELFLLPVPPLCPQPPLSPSLPGSAFGVRSQPTRVCKANCARRTLTPLGPAPASGPLPKWNVVAFGR